MSLTLVVLYVQVRFHVHIPCQLVNFVMSAAILPRAICEAGFSGHSLWQCGTIGIIIQFLIGVALSSIMVVLNEKRLRGMYLRSISMQSSAGTKSKSA